MRARRHRWLAGALALAAPVAPVLAKDAAPAADAGSVTLADVDVAVANAPSGEIPRARNAAAEGQGLRLFYAKGDAIDAAFVRAQFARNGLIGTPVSTATLVDLVQLINQALIREGYVNTGVVIDQQPALGDGARLKLRLVYGRLGSADGKTPGVALDWGARGKRGLSDEWVRAHMPSTQATPVDAAAIERDFRLLSDDPAVRTVRADLKGLDTAGEAQLSLTVEPAAPYDLYVTVANNRSPSVGGERAALGGSARNLLTSTDVFAFEVGRTSGVDDAVVSYATPLFDYDLRLSARAGLNNAAVIDPDLLALDISARDRFVEVGLAYTLAQRPLLPTGVPGQWISARALTAGLTFVHRRTRTFLFGMPFSFTPGSVRGRAEYSALRGTLDFVDRGPSQAITVSLIGTLGLEGTRTDVPGLPQPPQNFKSLVLQANYARRLTDHRLELRARVTGQWTDDLLYTAERFSVGGSATVRGYRENLILADRGVAGSLELAQPFSLTGAKAADGVDLGAFTASVFLDGAWVDNIGPADPRPRWIASAGASLLWTPSDALSARITYGQQLKDTPLVGRRDIQDRGFQFFITVRPLALFGYR